MLLARQENWDFLDQNGPILHRQAFFLHHLLKLISVLPRIWFAYGKSEPLLTILGHIPDQPYREKILTLELDQFDPFNDGKEIRQTIAEYYNQLYRRDKKSQYDYKNVCITSGGKCPLFFCSSFVKTLSFGRKGRPEQGNPFLK